MSNLIPEKRVDKNGVLTTKHVRASKPAVAGRSLPAPTVSQAPKQAIKVKEPTKRQLHTRLRHISIARHESDKGLEDRLGVSWNDSFTANDAQIYSVLSVTSPGNALLLLKDGARTAEEATARLDELGLGRLMEDNSALTGEMLSRRIYPETYFSVLAGEGDASPNFLDYVEYMSIDSLFEFHEMGREVKAGSIKLADVKALGVGRIKKSEAEREIREYLQACANGTTNTTMNDAKIIFEKYGNEFSSISYALALNSRYGSEFGTVIEPDGFVMGLSRRLTARVEEDERIAKVIKYGLLVRDAFYEEGSRIKEMPSDMDMVQLYDSEVPPEQVAQGVTAQQWDAIKNNEVAPSISGGWL